jgi:diaminopimelate epimerase
VIQRVPNRAELLRLGPLVEHHTRFPERTNVQLVRVDGEHDLTVGVWERGAGETLSSGTSAVAAERGGVRERLVREPGHGAPARRRPARRASRRARALTGPAEEICTVELAEEFQL